MTKQDKPADTSQQELSQRAMDLKNEAPAPNHPSNEPESSQGMINTPNTGIAPSGAFGAEGQRPVLERSRKAR